MNTRVRTLVESRQSQEARLDGISSQIGKTMTARSAQTLQESTQKLIEQSSDDIKSAQSKLDSLIDSKIQLENDIMDEKLNNSGAKDIQTFEFVANEFNTDLDTVAKWFIFTIIFVFDPLAVALVMAYNMIVIDSTNKKNEISTDVEDESEDEISNDLDNEPEDEVEDDTTDDIIDEDVEYEYEDVYEEQPFQKVTNVITKDGIIRDSDGQVIAESKSK